MILIPNFKCDAAKLKEVADAMGDHRRVDVVLGYWYFDSTYVQQDRLPALVGMLFDDGLSHLTFERAEPGDEVMYLGKPHVILGGDFEKIKLAFCEPSPWEVSLVKTFEVTVDRIESRSKTFSVRAADQEAAEELALKAATDSDYRLASAKEPCYEVTNVR